MNTAEHIITGEKDKQCCQQMKFLNKETNLYKIPPDAIYTGNVPHAIKLGHTRTHIYITFRILL
uniref:Uncharacterized protein n=1 Tax=Rhizophora mucronata TaxID=61149 RepID=A0A2P2J078_RHIMU